MVLLFGAFVLSLLDHMTKLAECRGLPILYHASCVAAIAATQTDTDIIMAYKTFVASGAPERYGCYEHPFDNLVINVQLQMHCHS